MLRITAIAVAAIIALGTLRPANLPAAESQLETDLLIAGGTESGCAAAIQAARLGVASITLVNDIKWLGGQFTAEALVAIDENRGPQGYGHGVPFPRSGLFKEVIDRIEAINLEKYGVARPGNTRVITTCRPADAEQAFRDLLQPYVDRGQVKIISNHFPVSCSVENNRLKTVRFRSTDPNAGVLTIRAKLTIDASDWGDVIKAAGANYEFGPDLQSKYGEPLAPTSREDYPLTDMNPITYCLVLVEGDGFEPIARPPGYDPRSYDDNAYPKDPLQIYASRRLVDHYTFKQIKHPDVLLLCFPTFDYPLDVLPQAVVDALEAAEPGASKKNIVQMTRHQRQLVFDDAKQFSLGYLYYLQTVVHEAMPDQTHSFARFHLSDEFGTADKLPFKPYVRESLRLKAMYMMRQQDTAGFGGRATNYANAMYHDGLAAWQFEYDFHPTGRRFLDKKLGAAGPWQNYFRKGRTWGPPYSGKCLFPLRSAIPEKIDGLLAAQKNLGYSSIVSSALRLHDQSMAIGQAIGAVAAVALKHDEQPRRFPFDRTRMTEIWSSLCARHDGGQPHMLWPFADLEPDHPAFEAANLLAIRGALPLRGVDVKFQPDKPATVEWMTAVMAKSLATKLASPQPERPVRKMTRGDFVSWWWSRLREFPDKPWQRKSPDDADGDGTLDCADALPLSTEKGSWTAWKLPPDEDGNPNAGLPQGKRARQFNFAGKESRPIDGFEHDSGLPFSPDREFGWSRDISQNQRQRHQLQGAWRDTFLFTRTHDRWECAVPNGRYLVTVCVGDSGYEQTGQNVTVEGHAVIRDLDTAIAQFAEKTVEVNVEDGRLTVDIGLEGHTTNTCLNWLRFVTLDGN